MENRPSPLSNVVAVVGRHGDFADGECREVDVDGAKCLLVKKGERYYALSSKCTHYGAPLAKGDFDPHLGIVRCPWHGACFNVATGDIEDYPGLDSLQTYSVDVSEDGNVLVTIPKNQVALSKRTKELGHRNPDQKETIAVIGGGASAQVLTVDGKYLNNTC